jgi:glycosyltransferase involved in cell wall biosynthesis
MQTAAIKFIVGNIEACDEVWVVSEGAGENLRSLGYKGDYIVMENGVDLPKGRAPEADIEKISAEYGLKPDVPVFLFVGRMMWYKGIRIILDGLFRAKRKGARFKMLFVGVGGDYGEIKELAGMLQLTDDCVFTGIVKDRQKLRAFFSRADMFLFPSTFDTNGIVVREAAACGLASVLICGSCAAEGIIDGRNGMLIEKTPIRWPRPF